MKKVNAFLVFFTLAMLPFAAAESNLFYKGSLYLGLEDESLSQGETLKANVTLVSLEEFPIAEAYLVFEVVQGKDYYYPTQHSDSDNIIWEEKVSGLNLAPNGKTSREFSFNLPENLKPGDYRLDVYAKTKKTQIVGAPHIFASPTSANFTVTGSQGSFPEAKILRTKTMFHQFLGPVGPGIGPGEEIENEVFLLNESGKSLSNAELFVGLCEWDDTACGKWLSTAAEKLSLKAGEEKSLNVKLVAPEMPDAYAIRIELRNSSGELLSLYRNRSIVYGPTAKIHQLNVNDYKFEEADEIELSMLLGPSPDHYKWPVFEAFKIKAWVEDMTDKNKVLVSEEKTIESISAPEFPMHSFSFQAPKELTLFKVCGLVEKQNQEHEKYCYVVDASKFPEKEAGEEIEVKWDYDSEEKALNLAFSTQPQGLEIDAAFLLMDFSAGVLVEHQNLKGKSPQNAVLRVPAKNYLLLLNNFSTGRQTKISISLDSAGLAPTLRPCSKMSGQKCTEEQVCDNPVPSSDSPLCCLTKCRDRISNQPKPNPMAFLYHYLIPAIAAILIIVLVAALLNARPRRREKKVVGEIVDKYFK